MSLGEGVTTPPPAINAESIASVLSVSKSTLVSDVTAATMQFANPEIKTIMTDVVNKLIDGVSEKAAQLGQELGKPAMEILSSAMQSLQPVASTSLTLPVSNIGNAINVAPTAGGGVAKTTGTPSIE